MPKTEDRFQTIYEQAYELFTRLSVHSYVRSSHLCGEAKRLVDRKRGEMDIVLVTVKDVAAVMFLDLSGRERIVVNFPFDGAILVALVGECL